MQRPVRPLSPLAGYVGGKKKLATKIIERIESIPHGTYAEPFLGMGGIFLRRKFEAEGEVVNDINKDVITFFRVLQRHYVAFMDMLKWRLSSRDEFQRLMAMNPDTLTDLERAARFLYLQRLSYGGKVHGRTFGYGVRDPARFDITRLAPLLEETHARLSRVIIECLPWVDFIGLYDREDTLFYLDPPYFGTEDYYVKGAFPRADFAALAERLAQIQGGFILSINDHPDVRSIFSAFAFEEMELTYTAGGKGKFTDAKELLIRGGPLIDAHSSAFHGGPLFAKP